MMLSSKFVKRLGERLGDEVHVAFDIADQDLVRVPIQITQALDDHADLWPLWEALTPGKRRSWSVRIAKLKSPEAKQRNIEKLLLEIGG